MTVKSAFTLAEVLITLVIIGVIAAMTIPTLINKTNKQEYVSKLKKAYSTLAQVTNRIIAEEGKPRADIGGWATDSENIYQLYKKYLTNAKDCLNGQGCFANETYKFLNGNNFGNLDTWNQASFRKLILSDGTSLLIDRTNTSCTENWDNQSNDCAQFWVDINGAKGPNTAGIDWFSFVLKENGLYPRGCTNDYCDTNASPPDGAVGLDCTCKVIRENAMNY